MWPNEKLPLTLLCLLCSDHLRIFNVVFSSAISRLESCINCSLCAQSPFHSTPIWLVFMTYWICIHAKEMLGKQLTHICETNELATCASLTFANCFEWSVFYDSFCRFKFHYIHVKKRMFALARAHTHRNFHLCLLYLVNAAAAAVWLYISSRCKVKSTRWMHAEYSVIAVQWNYPLCTYLLFHIY